MSTVSDSLLISADSHVVEDPHLWQERLPKSLRDHAPVFPERRLGAQFQTHPGGHDPSARISEMEVDGVRAEVLYPSLAMNLFGLGDAKLQEACFSVYNDWISEYSAVAPDHAFGIAMIATFDIDQAIGELQRCHDNGLVGAMVWEVPPAELSFATDHYDRFWAAASELEMPISVHSLTGVPYTWPRRGTPFTNSPLDGPRHANEIINETAYVISDVISSGTLQRFPELKFVIVESEASWIPAYLARHDHYYRRAENKDHMPLLPSEYFERQFSVTFFNDPALGGVLNVWGEHFCMWSSDFPHSNSTWPHSRSVIERDLGHLSQGAQRKLLADNAIDLYHLSIVNT